MSLRMLVAVLCALLTQNSIAQPWTPPQPTTASSRDPQLAPRRFVPVPPKHRQTEPTTRSSELADIGPIHRDDHATSADSGLKRNAGQVWREYDISTFTRRLRDQSKPEQVMVDWILRETGTDTWFGETMGVLSATPNSIRVYHTPQVQAIVEQLMDRFLNSRSEQNEVAVRLVTIDHPNWRENALPMMTPVKTQTPGIEAWILSRENASLLLNQLGQRFDFREHNSPNLTIYNGQSHTLKSTRPRLYTTANSANAGWGGNVEQVDEGFSMQISPLIAADNRSIEAVIKCKVDQVEQMSPLRVSNVDQFGNVRYSQIQVPQISSWQLHERFRWPKGEVLLISRGIVATPGPTNRPGITRMLGNKAPRANALLFLESRSEIESIRSRSSVAQRTDTANYRGRY